MAKHVAEKADPVKKPADWDKAVSVAYLRILGANQKDAAMGAGCSERSVVNWEQCSWWDDAKREAKDRWLQGLAGVARKTVLRGAQEDWNLALKLLERLDESMMPPKNRTEHSGNIGAGVLRVSDVLEVGAWERSASNRQADLGEKSAEVSNRLSGIAPPKPNGNGKNGNGSGRGR